mmetsp:Transcript_10555/g.24807  ORF Transcript_10555/g.24807 Transcript_10555/m.24807 type:complete len:243 (-) Transcript_10555:192-920(-)
MQREQLTDHLLVHQVGHELDGSGCHNLVIPLVSTPELQDDPPYDQVSNLREFGVDDRNKPSKDMREARRGHLRSDHRPCEEPPPPDQVLREELLHEILDVGHVHLVHQPVDALPQSLPSLSLVLWAGLIVNLLLQPRHLVRGDVNTTAPSQGLNLGNLALLVSLKVLILTLELLLGLHLGGAPRRLALWGGRLLLPLPLARLPLGGGGLALGAWLALRALLSLGAAAGLVVPIVVAVGRAGR